VLPGQHQTRIGILVRVTASPITTWGSSSLGLEVGSTLHHVRDRLPAVVRVVAVDYPLAGSSLRARRVYRR